VTMDDMKDATISVGSIIWRGDFTTLSNGAAAPASGTENEPAAATPETAPSPAAAQPDSASQAPIGFTGAPNGAPAPLLGKTISYCMDQIQYQSGTTMFTDGTTGWTQQCANGG